MARTVVESVPNAVLYSDGCIRVDGVVCSYPHVDKPWRKNDGDTLKFSITGLAPKETHDEAKKLLVRQINRLLEEAKMGKIGAEHKFVRDGGSEDDATKPEQANMWVIKASENVERPPKVRDQRTKLLTPDEIRKLIYAGCIINILIRPWAQNNKHGKKINANLIAVQFVRDGERIGEAAIDDDDAWDVLDVEEETDLGKLDDDEDL